MGQSWLCPASVLYLREGLNSCDQTIVSVPEIAVWSWADETSHARSPVEDIRMGFITEL